MQLDFFHSQPAGDASPLAAKMRPTDLEHYVGQRHLLGAGKPLRRLLDVRQLQTSLLFWGPPGCGKTTLALVIAETLQLPLEKLSAVESGVKELRAVVDRARTRGGVTLLFIDEIHRYGKTQQDALLPHVESGLFRLLGATTENPRSCLTPALLSRCKVYRLQPLDPEELRVILERALGRAWPGLEPQLAEEALERLLTRSRGDARRALSLLEQAVLSSPIDSEGRPVVSADWVDAQVPDQGAAYRDADHQAHMSALIKSIRGSDPHAALYWMARLVYGGENVDYITRRLRVSASEDIGLADPQAIIHTHACCEAAEKVGYPEARYPLSQAVVYLSLAPKSDSLGGFFVAEEAVARDPTLPVPEWLVPGGPYKNPHQEQLHFRRVPHLPRALEGTRFYVPGNLGYEIKLAQRLQQLWEEA